MNDKSNYLAEITDSSVCNFTAQCWQWDKAPEFGCLVCAPCDATLVYGMVYRVHAGSDDQSRSVYPYQKTLEELRSEQPHIFEFLKTEFSVLILGCKYHDQLVYGCASSPALLHTFVRDATPQEYQQLLSEPHYLHSLFGQMQLLSNVDEVLLALLRQANTRKVLNRAMLVDCLDTFGILSDQDYRRLAVLAQRLERMVG